MPSYILCDSTFCNSLPILVPAWYIDYVNCVSMSGSLNAIRYTGPPDAKETDTMHTEVVRSYQLVECVCALCQAGCYHSKACSSRQGQQYRRKDMDLVVLGLKPRTFRLPGACSTIELHRIAT